MSLAILAIVLGIALHAWDRFRASRELVIHTGWTLQATVHSPADTVRDASVQCFGHTDRRWVECGSIDFHQRGDSRITRVVNPQHVRFADIPSLFSVAIATVEGRTEVTMRIDPIPGVRIRRSLAKWLDSAADAELTAAAYRLGDAAAKLRKEREAYQEQREHRQRCAKSTPFTSDSDYELLGLKPGATLEQVQKAYRIACRKYHPDRLTGQNVEPHLVELAVQRFKEVAAAYQRIKDRHPQAQRATAN